MSLLKVIGGPPPIVPYLANSLTILLAVSGLETVRQWSQPLPVVQDFVSSKTIRLEPVAHSSPINQTSPLIPLLLSLALTLSTMVFIIASALPIRFLIVKAGMYIVSQAALSFVTLPADQPRGCGTDSPTTSPVPSGSADRSKKRERLQRLTGRSGGPPPPPPPHYGNGGVSNIPKWSFPWIILLLALLVYVIWDRKEIYRRVMNFVQTISGFCMNIVGTKSTIPRKVFNSSITSHTIATSFIRATKPTVACTATHTVRVAPLAVPVHKSFDRLYAFMFYRDMIVTGFFGIQLYFAIIRLVESLHEAFQVLYQRFVNEEIPGQDPNVLDKDIIPPIVVEDEHFSMTQENQTLNNKSIGNPESFNDDADLDYSLQCESSGFRTLIADGNIDESSFDSAIKIKPEADNLQPSTPEFCEYTPSSPGLLPLAISPTAHLQSSSSLPSSLPSSPELTEFDANDPLFLVSDSFALSLIASTSRYGNTETFESIAARLGIPLDDES